MNELATLVPLQADAQEWALSAQRIAEIVARGYRPVTQEDRAKAFRLIEECHEALALTPAVSPFEPMQKECLKCGGTGDEDPENAPGAEKCRWCGGKGWVDFTRIESAEDLAAVEAQFEVMNQEISLIEKTSAPMCEFTDRMHNRETGKRAELKTPRVAERQHMKDLIALYYAEQENKRQVERAAKQREADTKARMDQANREREARAEVIRAQAIREKAEKAAADAKSALAADRAAINLRLAQENEKAREKACEEVYMTPMEAQVIELAPVQKAAGVVTVRGKWRGEVVDKAALPDEYKIIDQKAIDKVADALRGQAKIPGVRIFQEADSVRAKG